MNFCNRSPSHRHQFFMKCSGVAPTGSSPSGLGCSTVGPLWGLKSCQQTCSSSSLHRSCWEPAPVQASPRVTSFRCFHVLQHGFFHGLQGSFRGSLLPQGLQGHSCLAVVCITSCRGTAAAPAAPPAPPCALTLVPGAFLLGYCHSSLAAFASVHFPLVKYIIPVSLAPPLMDLAMARGRSILEPPGIGSVGHVGSFCQLLSECTLVAPPATRSYLTNPIQQNKGTNWQLLDMYHAN